MPDFSDIKSRTNATYDRVASHWDAGRNTDLHERPWIDRLLAGLPAPASVLDLGCGSARPIGQYIASLGHTLTGVDASPAMLALARQRVPAAMFHEMDLTALDLRDTFDAVLSWDGTFHLSVAEQRTLLPKLAALTAPCGNLLLTIGYGESETTGTVAGQTVYHASLDPDEYIQTLTHLGFETVTCTANDPDTHGHHIILATNKTAV
ncbi:methyltransferase family protein [Shimia isoporae]|uniref:Methyltransferase family protein n=1 Tax=Shimia isoporae TaxID=647720 RepID=A0A4R1NJ07_9RHOB|nr:class I SAM-dependent methyltransferase [Shimia isoporae]TCL08226.1 methyltransferase family protein [Shimia isoporae]